MVDWLNMLEMYFSIFQLFDNALITAGLLDDPREMVGRLNTLLSKVMTRLNIEENKKDKQQTIIT